jgi:hypothetical protein
LIEGPSLAYPLNTKDRVIQVGNECFIPTRAAPFGRHLLRLSHRFTLQIRRAQAFQGYPEVFCLREFGIKVEDLGAGPTEDMAKSEGARIWPDFTRPAGSVADGHARCRSALADGSHRSAPSWRIAKPPHKQDLFQMTLKGFGLPNSKVEIAKEIRQ